MHFVQKLPDVKGGLPNQVKSTKHLDFMDLFQKKIFFLDPPLPPLSLGPRQFKWVISRSTEHFILNSKYCKQLENVIFHYKTFFI